MKRIILALGLCLMLSGCPAGTKQQQVAQAADNASIVIQNFQQAEIVAYQQGVIPAADHQFIQQQLFTLATLGKTTDSCIKTATNTAGSIACAQTAITTIDQLNSQGALYLKSTQAKTDYSIALLGLRTALASIVTLEGGTPPTLTISTTGGGN